jgi:hypothetical protein
MTTTDHKNSKATDMLRRSVQLREQANAARGQRRAQLLHAAENFEARARTLRAEAEAGL